ncbi:MAG TPA: cytochrome c peroxidase [Micropepsaceae bacterium]|nr:cytochrome c peroxidase [Micropepsaceae bacterium]
MALLAGVTTNGFSAAPEGDPESAKDTASAASRSFGELAGKNLVSIEGSTLAVMPVERGLTREVVAPNGTAQKILFTFVSDKLGMVLNASDSTRVIGMFRTIDAGIQIQYADGSDETLSANKSGGITSELISAASDCVMAWYPEGHVFSLDERKAALARYAVRVGLADPERAAKSDCMSSFAPAADNGVKAAAPEAGAPVMRESSAMLSPQALLEIAQVEAEIDRIEAQTIKRLSAPPDNQAQQVALLGKAMMYDKQLSVNRNEACAFCHMPEAGFTGPVSELNRATGSYPGSVRTRFSERKPGSQGYSPLSPVLHYNSRQGGFVGGNFWDMRATGRRLGDPASEQAQEPMTNPLEMGLPDIACAVYRASQRPYRALFERVWGRRAFAIAWPSDVGRVCDRPGPPPAGQPTPVRLGPLDRDRVGVAFDQMARSIAGYEGSVEVTAFTSKFDAVLAGKAQFATQEKAGYQLFRGKAQCNACHREVGPGEKPLFTDFTAANIGTPANPRLPYYEQNQPDALGYIANPAGSSFVDGGVGGFLAMRYPSSQPSTVDSQWGKLAAGNQARIKVPTLRNVDKRPNPAFVKAYGHNGYFKSLKTIVHFYNTRDVLPRCQPHDVGEGTTCWPAPESTANMNTTQVGRLGLSAAEEDAIVSFMQTLTDGFLPIDRR